MRLILPLLALCFLACADEEPWPAGHPGGVPDPNPHPPGGTPDAGPDDPDAAPTTATITGHACEVGDVRAWQTCGTGVVDAEVLIAGTTTKTTTLSGGLFSLPRQAKSNVTLRASEALHATTAELVPLGADGGATGVTLHMLTLARLDDLYAFNHPGFLPGNGTVVLTIRTAAGPLQDAVLSPLDGEPAHYDAGDPDLFPQGTGTSATGFVIFFDITPGQQTFSITSAGLTHDKSIIVPAGAVVFSDILF